MGPSLLPEPEFAPVRRGDWVECRYSQASVAVVKKVHWDNEWLLDLIIYDRKGDKVGRESPAMGGPRTFEPCCKYEDWQRIEEPIFPIEICWVPGEDGRQSAEYSTRARKLGDGKFATRRRKSRAVRGIIKPLSNFDPDREAYAKRTAAAELRAIARSSGNDSLLVRAGELEAEAAALLLPMT